MTQGSLEERVKIASVQLNRLHAQRKAGIVVQVRVFDALGEFKELLCVYFAGDVGGEAVSAFL